MNISFARVLNEQCALHPIFAPQDALKLCYQASFGAEHLLNDPTGAQDFFEQEYRAAKPRGAKFCVANARATVQEPLLEWISADFCRVNLRAWKVKKLPSLWLFRLFLQSTQPAPFAVPNAAAQTAQFHKNTAQISALCEAGTLPFSAQEWQSALSAYLSEGVHAVHHSNAYRAAECPAYRLIRTQHLPLLTVLEKLATLPAPSRGGAQIVAFDGRCGAGKTTYAQTLAAVLQTDTVQLDDFFLPAEKRTPTRLAEAGGNVDYERFSATVLPQLRHSAAFEYLPFRCDTMQLGEPRQIGKNNWRVVEGSYSHHPYFKQYADVFVFVDIDPKCQIQRIQARNGDAWAEDFREKWIPMEERYFTTYHIQQQADIVLK